MKKKVIRSIGLVMMLLLLALPTTFAANGFSPFHVIASEEGDTITDSISDAFSILVGQNVKVQHNIFGTTIVAGNGVTVDSDIDGDLIVMGRNITLSGKVLGNLYAAGDGLTIKGSVSKDAFICGNSLILDKSSVLGRDATLFGATVNTYGQIKRDAVVYADKCSLYGSVGRDMHVSAEEITIANGATIAGEFAYQSENDALIQPGASIKGGVNKNITEKAPVKTPASSNYLWDILFTLGVAVVFWAFLLLVAPRLLDAFAYFLANKPGKAAGFGAIVLFSVPMALLLLLFTIIGIPLSLILGVFYVIMLCLAFFISAGAFGIVMFKNVFGLGDLHKNIWYVLAGVLAIKLLTMLPFIGWIISLASVVFGFGLFFLLLMYLREKQI